MKQLLLLSDTHGLLRDEVKAQLREVDAVIHAGDITTAAVMNALRTCPDYYVVRGNNDYEYWARQIPHTLRFTIEGVRFFLVHDKMDVPADLSEVDVVLYGHSHRYSAEEHNGILWLNPGSCGKRRFREELSFCRMAVEHGEYRIEKIPLSD